MNIQKYINNDIKQKKHAFNYNIQIQIFLFFGIIALIITTIKYNNILILTSQFIIYYFIMEEIRCKIYGGCIFSSWVTTFIPIIGIIIYILDYFKLFNNFKTKIKLLQSKYNININKNKFII